MLTAHGGALKTGRNSKAYFELMSKLNADAIEVDKERRVILRTHTYPIF